MAGQVSVTKPPGPQGPHQDVFAAVFARSPWRLSVSLSIPLNWVLRTCSVDRRDVVNVITPLVQSFFASVNSVLCRLGCYIPLEGAEFVVCLLALAGC